MIFVTVGAQMPFDRLVRAVDQWAGLNGQCDFFAQIGSSNYQPVYMRCEQFLEPARFRRLFREASLIVAHAGMGSIITALEMAKPILVMPRRGDLAETRNDHQVATARRFAELGAVYVAMDEKELSAQLDNLVGQGISIPGNHMGCRLLDGSCPSCTKECSSLVGRQLACPRLLNGLQAFIEGTPVLSITYDLHHHSRS